MVHCERGFCGLAFTQVKKASGLIAVLRDHS